MRIVAKSTRRVVMMTSAAATLAVIGMLTSPQVAVSAPAADPAAPTIVNGDFATVTTNGEPASWSRWNPVGTATVSVEKGAAPGGTNDVAITSTSGATARLALTQSVPVTDATPRRLVISGDAKGDGLSGGLSELRVQVYDASNKVLVPVQKGPYLSGTFDWKHLVVPVTLPVGAARVSVEPMLDQAAGTIRYANISIAVDDSNGSLAATPDADGRVELTWSYVDQPAADHYAVYRAEGDATPALDAAHLVRTAYALSTADDTASSGTTYTYVVAAQDASDKVLAVTPAKTVTTPATFDYGQQNSVLSAVQDGAASNPVGSAHVSWLAADDTSADLQLLVNGTRVDLPAQVGGAVVAAAPGETLTLQSAGSTIATTTVGAQAHPRSILTPTVLERVRSELAAQQPTITGAWNATLARIAGPDSGYITNGSAGLYRARDAAFVYAVTGDQDYATLAYTSLMAGVSFVAPRDTNEGLEIARADLLLAPAYDWAYNGWSSAQRTQVRHVMTRAIDILATYHHSALDSASKTSNWVGVVRSTELALILAARGDGDFGWYDQRVGYLTDQVAQHLDQDYSDDGYTQEGWDYFHYTELYMFPSIYFAQGTGMNTLDSHFDRPAFWNLALHVASSRPKGDTTQFGVGYENGQLDGALPLLAPVTPKDALPALKSIYDQVEGVDAPSPAYDGVQGVWADIYYPVAASDSPADATNPALKTAILDDGPGFYAFRNQIKNKDDALLVTSNRNSLLTGWSAAETFSLSWMSDDTTWAALGGKDYTAPLEWSKPLVDGKLEPYANEYTTTTGAGKTIASRAFDGQGGGYLHLDGSGNFGVTTADREEVVDLHRGGVADSIVAIHDTFGDTMSHEWDWQLHPEAGVTININASPTAGAPNFTFVSPNGSTLSGFLLDGEGASIKDLSGTLRIAKTGTNASFTVVLAASAHGALTVGKDTTGDAIVDGRVINVTDLSKTPTSGLAPFVPTVTASAGGECKPGNGKPAAPSASGTTNVPNANLVVTVDGASFPVSADASGNWTWTADSALPGERAGKYTLHVAFADDAAAHAEVTLCR